MPLSSSSCRIFCILCSLFFAVVMLFSCLVVPSSSWAQTTFASVYGRVTDQSGAILVMRKSRSRTPRPEYLQR